MSDSFRERFGREPRWRVAAPGRVNMIGEHTDYNDGFVLPMAIERSVVLTAAHSDSPGITVHSVAQNERVTIDPEDNPVPDAPHWASYVRGVIEGCHRRGMEPGPMDVLLESDVPLGGGLSSSAALEVATATLLEAVTGMSMEPMEKTLLCQTAEHEYAKVPCGIMDQFSSVHGRRDHLMLLDCESLLAEMVPLNDPEVTVLIINSNVRHELTGGEYAERRASCAEAARLLGVPSLRHTDTEQLEKLRSEPILYRRAKHVVTEIQRTRTAAAALAENDWDHLGELMKDSHLSLRDDYMVSCPELDLLVELAQRQGVIGSRMTGGGFGGCTVSLVRTESVGAVTREIAEEYRKRTGIEATAFTTRPAEGARALSV